MGIFRSMKVATSSSAQTPSTASECTLTAVLAAKTKFTTFLLQQNPLLTPSQVWDKLVVYASCQAHSSVERAALLASVRFHVLNTDDMLAVRGPTLRAVVQEDRNLGFIPMAMVATLGTTNSCAFDNLEEIGVVCKLSACSFSHPTKVV
ncbi:hypothetical protein HPB51_021893 [Rhipicephalus microplus]|uniref:Aromatic-L-amino-acid decarboxylase n=1 Tax=Rhipicephalus microplus TaxID=6941 RepID=A0A9J6EIW9_RHIMP|nr:hypothetical protein HPB51_021893 [Rhipicephalus microplus]